MYGRSPKGFVDLVKLLEDEDRSIGEDNFAKRMHGIHE